ncbi:peptidase S14 [Mizugakiibacter sediminis]|uniref:ATP-dependent Clp protease proteolytic subunit n=1 Tax=Mizugakiibacter sediminis TaxID=1475481 RepID=A0A0K8QQ35_9GAMM|nr:head maturation protease, ClpP-related [Mizugakiibacter sediminis]GAP66801.1 peptidase S14 [Mizugakiibacter sediminis]
MNRDPSRLLALQAKNKDAPRAYRIENAANEATIYLYDVIGYDWWTGGGITALQFAADLNALRGIDTVHLRFNSPGGDVFDGRAIAAALDAFPAKKVGHVDGWAASAASFILMHCDAVEIAAGAMIMIHNGWTIAAGDNRVMADTAALLQKIDAAIQDDYMRRVNVERQQVVDWMNAETWFTAEEAVQHGLADRIASGDGAKARAAWNVEAYAHAPAADPAPVAEEPQNVADEPEADTPENPTADAEHAHRLRMVAVASLTPA